MNIKIFKRIAAERGNYVDNTAAANKEWSRTWGLSFHSLLWAWKQYTVGNMTWKGGRVHLRHGSYMSVDCFIDGKPVSEYRFKKALVDFTAPDPTADELAYMHEQEELREAEWKRQAEATALRAARRARRAPVSHMASRPHRVDAIEQSFAFAS